MLIERVTATPVAVPLRTPLRTALGVAACSRYGLVTVETDDGHCGVGEIALIWHGDGAALCTVVQDLIAPAIIGRRADARGAVVEAARRALEFGRHSLAALAAIDMALLDLHGKALGEPAVALLGGAMRERIALSMSLSIAPTDAVLAQAADYVGQGFRALKVKSDADVEHTVEVVEALRREHPEIALRVDFNMGCTDRKHALRAIERLARCAVISVEQPLPADDLAGSAFLTAHSPIPVMLDESVWDEADAYRAIAAGACDMVNIYVSEAGGPSAALRIAALCDVAGVPIAIGSMPELAVGTAAAAAFAFACRRLDHPSDVCGHLYHAGDVVTHDLRVEDGCLLPPRRPGLGVEIDTEQLAYYTQAAA